MIPRLRAWLLLSFWFGSIAVLGPIVIVLARLTRNEDMIYGPVRGVVRLGLRVAGVAVEVNGLDHLDERQVYLFTPNHQSLIDVPIVLTFLGRNVGYLAKKELFRYPVFGQGIRLIGVVPVDRSDSHKAVLSARAASDRLRAGKDYVVYPEGTRSPDGRLLPFKKGAFLMAIDAGVPVVPVTICGATEAMPKGEIKLYPAQIRLTVHPPIDVGCYAKTDVNELMEAVRSRVLSRLPPQSGTHGAGESGTAG